MVEQENAAMHIPRGVCHFGKSVCQLGKVEPELQTSSTCCDLRAHCCGPIAAAHCCGLRTNGFSDCWLIADWETYSGLRN